MKEYKVQMLVDGEWKNGRHHNTGHVKTFTDKRKAMRHMDYLGRSWQEYDEWQARCIAKNSDRVVAKTPTEYRLVERDVTEWKPLP